MIVSALQPFDERDQRTILSTVCAHLDIELNVAAHTTKKQISQDVESKPHAAETKEPKHGIDIRTLKEQKLPSSARQMACVVAYYLQEHAPLEERKQTISTSDIEKYFKQAGFKLPEKLGQVLADSKKSGYFESVGRGEYKLTRVGYNLVTHSMPQGEK